MVSPGWRKPPARRTTRSLPSSPSITATPFAVTSPVLAASKATVAQARTATGDALGAGYEFGNTSDANIWTYNGPLSNAEFLRAVQSRNVWHGGESGMDIRTLSGGDVYLYSLARIHQMMQANPEQWIRSETPAQWYNAHIANVNELDERITSLYFMGTADFTERLKGQAGLRWERTREIGYDFDPLSPEQVRAAGYAVSAATGRAATGWPSTSASRTWARPSARKRSQTAL